MSKGKHWKPAEDEAILRLRDVARLGWKAIAEKMPGRTPASCEQRYYGKLKGARDRAPRPTGPAPSLPVVSWRKRGAAIAGVVAAPAVEIPPVAVDATARQCGPLAFVARGRVLSTEVLRDHAALVARIQVCGDLTRGWFGDPPPGRSALDGRTRAAAEAVQRAFSIAVSDG
jgi:hypothetical protein